MIAKPGAREQRSLFGEILDWMLAPLLLLWPLATWLLLAPQRRAPDPDKNRPL